MQIHSLAASFGRLENDALALQPGLNIIEGPNEGGKSTWTALLRVMLYGLNTKDRSATADKRRYLPWSGAPMEGRLEADTVLGGVTLTRRTARANAPMGTFSAVYTGTNEAVAGLTAADCGETLLGVSQDVFVRSAFIGQSAMEVRQNPDLEQRITALISTGEEDTSYTAAADRLRKQLNRRRYNRTGLLPQLENELNDRRRELEEIEALEAALHQAEAREPQLTQRLQELRQELSLHDAADRAQRAQAALETRDTMNEAQARADALARKLQDIPSREELEAIRGSIAALADAKAASHPLRQQADEAADALTQAEAELAGLPMTWPAALPMGAALADKPRPRLSLASPILAILAAAVHFAAPSLGIEGLPAKLIGGAFLLAALAAVLLFGRKRKAWDKRNAALFTQRTAEMEAYTILNKKVQAAAETSRQTAALRDAAQAQQDGAAVRILAQVRAFQPDAATIPAALAAVEEGIRRHAALQEARQTAHAAALRWDMVSADAAEVQPVQRPLLSRGQLQEEMARVSALLADLRRELHTGQGRIQALGDPAELRLQIAEDQARQAELQEEYDAIALAAEVLAGANTALQNRFSPALGEKAAAIFTKLTKMKYNRVFLNREMVPSAQEAGQIAPHEAGSLSRGTADQLYLAVRLAICDLVLPEQEAAPIVLDDALVNFDDGRMAAALDYLAELGEKRQILLFTCQSREAAYLSKAHPGRFHRIAM